MSDAYGNPAIVRHHWVDGDGAAPADVVVTFDNDMTIHVREGSGLSGRFYTFKPLDLRMEGRVVVGSALAGMQRCAVNHVIRYTKHALHRFDYWTDKDGDVVAQVRS